MKAVSVLLNTLCKITLASNYRHYCQNWPIAIIVLYWLHYYTWFIWWVDGITNVLFSPQLFLPQQSLWQFSFVLSFEKYIWVKFRVSLRKRRMMLTTCDFLFFSCGHGPSQCCFHGYSLNSTISRINRLTSSLCLFLQVQLGVAWAARGSCQSHQWLRRRQLSLVRQHHRDRHIDRTHL